MASQRLQSDTRWKDYWEHAHSHFICAREATSVLQLANLGLIADWVCCRSRACK